MGEDVSRIRGRVVTDWRVDWALEDVGMTRGCVGLGWRVDWDVTRTFARIVIVGREVVVCLLELARVDEVVSK